MPIGNPTQQSKATRKYEEKTGWISKSYKLKKEIVEEFAKACEKNGEGQATALTRMMRNYIEVTNDTKWYKMIHFDTKWYKMIHHDTLKCDNMILCKEVKRTRGKKSGSLFLYRFA